MLIIADTMKAINEVILLSLNLPVIIAATKGAIMYAILSNKNPMDAVSKA